MNNIKYLDPPTEVIGKGPHKSEWISYNFLYALQLDRGKEFLCCLARMHASHFSTYLGKIGKPSTPFLFMI